MFLVLGARVTGCGLYRAPYPILFPKRQTTRSVSFVEGRPWPLTRVVSRACRRCVVSTNGATSLNPSPLRYSEPVTPWDIRNQPCGDIVLAGADVEGVPKPELGKEHVRSSMFILEGSQPSPCVASVALTLCCICSETNGNLLAAWFGVGSGRRCPEARAWISTSPLNLRPPVYVPLHHPLLSICFWSVLAAVEGVPKPGPGEVRRSEGQVRPPPARRYVRVRRPCARARDAGTGDVHDLCR